MAEGKERVGFSSKRGSSYQKYGEGRQEKYLSCRMPLNRKSILQLIYLLEASPHRSLSPSFVLSHLETRIFSHCYHSCFNVVDVHTTIRGFVFAKRNLVQAFGVITLTASQTSCQSSFSTNQVILLKWETAGNTLVICLSVQFPLFITSLSVLRRSVMQTSLLRRAGTLVFPI